MTPHIITTPYQQRSALEVPLCTHMCTLHTTQSFHSPIPNTSIKKSPLTLRHSVTALSHAAIFVSFPHLLLHQQHSAELQPSGSPHRTAGRCHGPSPSPRLPQLRARVAQSRRAKTRSERRGEPSARPRCQPYVVRCARRPARREGEDFRGTPAGRSRHEQQPSA